MTTKSRVANLLAAAGDAVKKGAGKLCARGLDFFRATGGIAASEFALIAPVMIGIYYGTVETGNVIIADRKVTAIAQIAADIVSQDKSITNAEMTDVFEAIDALIFPFPAGNFSLVISCVDTDGTGKSKIAWSDGHNAAARAKDSSYALPTGLAVNNASVIMAEVTYTYSTAVGRLFTDGVTMTDRFYMRPRRSTTITRTTS
jgi:Flp pilus assembly protein TadG